MDLKNLVSLSDIGSRINPITEDSKLLHRHTTLRPPLAVGGDGIYVIDEEGNRYLDGSGGAAVSCLGHSDEEIKEALIEQIKKLPYAHTAFFTSEPAEKLAKFLVERAPENIGHAYFLNGGSEAVETCLKLARQYFVDKGLPKKGLFISRRQSYHGNTLGALGVGGNEWRKEPFLPILKTAKLIDPCYEYRFRKDGESEEDFSLRMANQLNDAIDELGEENVAAFICEPVVGATLGVVPATKGYLQRIREICDERNILFIADEVMCGSGRTGELFASYDVKPDLITMAKSLGGGFQPIGAALISDKIYNTIKESRGYFQHGHTYLSHVAACASSLAVQEKIERENLLTNVKERGAELLDKLKERFGNEEFVGDIRGVGLFLGLEFVKNKQTKEPFDPALKFNSRMKYFALSEGLVCYPMGGTVDGKIGDHLMLAPPYIITSEEVDEIVEKLGAAYQKAVSSL